MGKRDNGKRAQVAVVLSMGGLKPLAAIPIFEFLEQQHIVPDLLVGCSGGSIIATMYAAGYSSKDIKEILFNAIQPNLFKKDWRAIMGMFNLPCGLFNRKKGLFKPDNLMALFDSLFQQKRLEDMQIKTILQTTDFETGDGVILEQGLISQAVYASSAAYPFFPAIQIDGRWLLDGVYSAPLPLLPAIQHNIDVIIAVEFMENIMSEPKGFFESMNHLNKMLTKTIMQSHTALSISFHHYEIIYVKVNFDKDVNLWDTGACEMILDAGKAAVESNRKNIIHAIDNWKSSVTDV